MESTALAAVRECRGNLELLGWVTKELESAPTLHLGIRSEVHPPLNYISVPC